MRWGECRGQGRDATRLQSRVVAELAGTFILVFVGCSVAVAGALQRPVAGPPTTRSPLRSPSGSPWSRVARGLLVEALITFILVFVVGLVASDPRVPSSHIAAIAVGFALAAGVFVGGPLTGGGVNPARALGPMIVSGQLDEFWIYIVGPLAGGLAGAFLAAFALKAFQMEA